MGKWTVIYSLLLILIGLFAYFGLGRTSVTALIPAFIGLPILILGILSLSHIGVPYTLYGALGLGGLAFLGTVSSLPKCIKLLAGEAVQRPNAVIIQSLVAFISFIYVICAIVQRMSAKS